jgi:hypothetical protein
MLQRLTTIISDPQWILAIGTAILALVALFAAYGQSRSASRATGAQVYFKLEEKFYHTDLMRSLRRRAAEELLNKGNEGFDAFDELANFFDFVGTMVHQGVLNKEMAASSFFRRATAFWISAEKKGAIGTARTDNHFRWDEYEWLVKTLSNLYIERRKLPPGSRLSEVEIERILKLESRLPTLAQQQQSGVAANSKPHGHGPAP